MQLLLLLLVALAAQQVTCYVGSRVLTRAVGASSFNKLQSKTALFKSGKIHEATIAGDLASVADILNKDPMQVKARDIEGQLPLHHAARNGMVDIVKLLLERGADCNVKNDKLRTPLQLAAQYSDGKWGPEFKEICEIFIKTGKADIKMIQRNDGMKTAEDYAKKAGWGKEFKALWEQHGSFTLNEGAEKAPGPGGYPRDDAPPEIKPPAPPAEAPAA